MSRLTTVAATLLCLASVASFSKTEGTTREIALNFSLVSAAIAITSEATDTFNSSLKRDKFLEIESDLRDQIKSLESTKKDTTRTLAEVKKLASDQASQLAVKTDALEALERQILGIKNQFQNKTDELNRKLKVDDTRIKEFVTNFKDLLIKDLRVRIDRKYNQLYTYITHKLELQDDEGNYKFASIHRPLTALRDKLEKTFDVHCNLLREIKNLPDEDVIVDAIEIFSEICDEITTFTRSYQSCFNADNKYEVDRLMDELGNVYDNLTTNYVQKDHAVKSLGEYHKYSDDKLKNLLPRIDESDQGLAELREQVSDLLDQIDLGNMKIANLNQKIDELSKPLQFFGAGSIAVAGNSISMFYYKNYGYRLDAINWTESETGYDLVYAIRQNPGLSDTELYQGNCREQLASFTNSLFGTLPEFTPNYQNCSLSLKVTLRKAIKKELAANDVFRDCDVIRSDKFGATIQKYHIDKGGKPTLRVMSATGGGKGIAIKNLVDYYTQNLDGYEIWLSDPQDGSDEDYWMCEKVARNASQAEKIFAKYANLLKARDANTSRDPNIPILGIFDEFDKKHNLDDKKLASEIWTTIRHQNMRLMLIGQCSEVGKNKWTWDDMSNCALLFIENGIDVFVKHAIKDLSMNEDDLTKFKLRHDKIVKWMREKNRDIDEVENHYRIACLYVSGRALLLEIPYALKAPISSGKSFLVREPFESIKSTQYIDSPNTLGSDFVEAKFEEVVLDVECPHCKSHHVKKNGKTAKGEQRYSCLDCDTKPKTFVNTVLPNINEEELDF